MLFRSPRYFYCPDISVVTLKSPNYKKVAWGDQYSKVCFEQFPKLIFQLCDGLSLEDQILSLSSFYRNAPIFRWRHLINLRAQGDQLALSVSRYDHVIRTFMPLGFQVLLFVVLISPRAGARALSRTVEVLRRVNYQVRSRLGWWREGE